MTLLPPRIAKQPKRSSRWRSQAHLNFVRQHACAMCGATCYIEAAHVRLGSNAGASQKPSDERAVSLCALCHREQHRLGERTFWQGRDVEALIDAYCRASPKRFEIEKIRRERGA